MVDLSGLKSLDIGVSDKPHLLENLASILPNLERLFFDIHPMTRREEDVNKDDEDMVSIVQKLNPLQYFSLRGLRSLSYLRQILSQHGPTLKGLMIQSTPCPRLQRTWNIGYKYPRLTGEDIAEIAEFCSI